MGILFGFTADDVTAQVADVTEGPNSTVAVTTPPTADPISDAVNNVRFACNGFAAALDFAGVDIRARSFFRFQLPEPGRITVHGHLTYGGVSTVIGQNAGWIFDNPGLREGEPPRQDARSRPWRKRCDPPDEEHRVPDPSRGHRRRFRWHDDAD
ncbi:MAG: hypothetical protein K0R87_508 [Pseudonocardia sp.]|nr:hypothetical protein [Pseudonocardia sp.]